MKVEYEKRTGQCFRSQSLEPSTYLLMQLLKSNKIEQAKGAQLFRNNFVMCQDRDSRRLPIGCQVSFQVRDTRLLLQHVLLESNFSHRYRPRSSHIESRWFFDVEKGKSHFRLNSVKDLELRKNCRLAWLRASTNRIPSVPYQCQGCRH